MACTIYVENSKAMISCAFTTQLICAFVLHIQKKQISSCRGSNATAMRSSENVQLMYFHNVVDIKNSMNFSIYISVLKNDRLGNQDRT